MDKIANLVANNAYLKTAKGMEMPGVEAKDKPTFGDAMKRIATQSIETMRGGETATAKAVAGTATLPEVVQAITAAEVTLQTVVAVRDRVMSAYQEIMRMPI